MTALVTDNFNRADNADLGTAWDVVTGQIAFNIVSNAAKRSDDLDCAETNNSVTWPNDQYSQGKITTSGTFSTGDGGGMTLRGATGATTYYRGICNKNGSSNIEIGKKVAGTYTTLGNRTGTFADGDTFYFEVQGTSLLSKINGVAQGAAISDASISSGRAGIAYSGEVGPGGAPFATVDDWEGGDFSSGATPIGRRVAILQATNRASTY